MHFVNCFIQICCSWNPVTKREEPNLGTKAKIGRVVGAYSVVILMVSKKINFSSLVLLCNSINSKYINNSDLYLCFFSCLLF